MNRGRLDVLVARERVHVGAVLEQEARGIDVAEEARQPKGVEAVVAERLREPRVLLEQFPYAIRPSERRCFEDRELLAGRELRRLVAVTSIQIVQYVRHI